MSPRPERLPDTSARLFDELPVMEAEAGAVAAPEPSPDPVANPEQVSPGPVIPEPVSPEPVEAAGPLTRSIVLWCPDWPIRAVEQAGLVTPGAPVALIEKGQVFACSAAARRDGVQRGLRVREAQSRCPELIALPYDQGVDARAFETVLEGLEALVPGVQVLRPGVCAIRARGPARYFGGELAAATALAARIAELGAPDARAGIADGPFTAEQAARSTTPARPVRLVPIGGAAAFLAPLPIALVDDAALVTLLGRLGIRTLADFAALPADNVRGRFGEYGAQLHALASGRDSSPVVPRVPPPDLDVPVDFEPPLDRVDQVTFGVRAAADRFIAQLTAAHLVCTAVRIEIESERGDLSERSWLHPRSFTGAEVVDRVRWQLQGGSAAETGLTAAVTRVRLVPETVDAISNHEQGLWGSAPDERVHSALSRVQSMLGHEAVFTAVLGGGRTLADRQRFVPWGDRPLLERSPAEPWPGHLPPPLPTTVFEHPLPVTVLDSRGEQVDVTERGALTAPPARVVAGAEAREIAGWAGPWTLDERWWDAAAAKQQHRFQVVDRSGQAWLLVLERGSWWMEARYD